MSRHILDELVHGEVVELLREKHISAVQVGKGWGQSGWLDVEQIIPNLHGTRCTFHTQDLGFFKSHLAHQTYSIVCYGHIAPHQLAYWIVRFLRHPEFNTHVKRLGKVILVTLDQIEVWQVHHKEKMKIEWVT